MRDAVFFVQYSHATVQRAKSQWFTDSLKFQVVHAHTVNEHLQALLFCIGISRSHQHAASAREKNSQSW